MKCNACGHQINLRVNNGKGLAPGHFFIACVVLILLTVVFAMLDYEALAWAFGLFAILSIMVNIISYQEIFQREQAKHDGEEAIIVCEHCGARAHIYPWSV